MDNTAVSIYMPCSIKSDVASNRKMLKMLLKKANVEVDMAEDGSQAVDFALSNPLKYDIIFMDNLMPNMVFLLLRLNLCQNVSVPDDLLYFDF